jgi:hypothetical protein
VKRPHKPFKPRKEDFHTRVHWSLKESVSTMAPEPGGHTRMSLIMLVNDTLVLLTTVSESDGSHITLIHADQPTDIRIVEMNSDRYGAPVKP